MSKVDTSSLRALIKRHFTDDMLNDMADILQRKAKDEAYIKEFILIQLEFAYLHGKIDGIAESHQ
jgi:hypothetical protein